MDHRPDNRSREDEKSIGAMSDAALARNLKEANSRIPVPPDLVARIACAIERDQRTPGDRWRLPFAAALAAAAVFVVALLGWIIAGSHAPAPPQARPQITVRAEASDHDSIDAPIVALPARPQVEVEFPIESGLFARQIDTSNPNVTLLMVYQSSPLVYQSSPSFGGSIPTDGG